jgi:hypothetical protein
MFMDEVTITREAAEEVWTASTLLDDPPPSLMVLLAWEEDDGRVTTVSAWESAASRGQVAADRMMPLFERGVLGERHGSPHPVPAVTIYLRPWPRWRIDVRRAFGQVGAEPCHPTVRPAETGQPVAGSMLWLKRKTFVGS